MERKIIGALTIYASEPDAFDEAEAGLLDNLSENLAYGISSIRTAEERRRSAEELKQYASRLEVTNQELQDFSFIAAHDLQEPLRKIQTFCDITQTRCGPMLDSSGREYLDRIINSASRMRQLLHDLLQFSRVATKPKPFEKADLNLLAHGAAAVLQAQLTESGGNIVIEDLPVIEADTGQMLQLFQNLIGNALRYRGNDRPNIKICSIIDEQACEIRVEDNGIGFDQKFAERIFKPFQRLHGPNAYDGTGMGLALCRKIAERHGGTIRADSEPGKGSTFIVRLPIHQSGEVIPNG